MLTTTPRRTENKTKTENKPKQNQREPQRAVLNRPSTVTQPKDFQFFTTAYSHQISAYRAEFSQRKLKIKKTKENLKRKTNNDYTVSALRNCFAGRKGVKVLEHVESVDFSAHSQRKSGFSSAVYAQPASMARYILKT